MTIERADIVDGMGLDTSEKKIILFISDHLSWDDVVYHISTLERKIGTYIWFISSNQCFEKWPEAIDWPVKINLTYQYEPNSEATEILEAVRRQLEAMNIRFSYESLPDGY